jgi:putative endopeptidase
VQRMFQLLGDPPASAAREAATVVRIETGLAKGSLALVERREPSALYHKLTLRDLAALNPSFSWDRYFSRIGLPDLKSLNVAVPAFFKAMERILRAESLQNWRTYLRWHLVQNRSAHLSSAFVSESFDFYGKTLTVAAQLEPRWKRCVRHVDRDLGEALGQAYVARTFGPEAKERTVKMVHEIEAAMERDILELPWMTVATKEQALAKLHKVANKIGYPDKWRDYSSLRIARADAIGNAERAAEFEFRRALAKIGKPIDRGEWGMTAPTVNAYYDAQMNDINFPAGVLQPPLFDLQMDDAPNYGDTGGTIGHELTHAFDDEGRKFDAEGNLRDWWTPVDAQEFEKRAGCISNQYSQYTVVDDVKINGKLTLGEDVADVGGLIIAYIAWKDATKGQELKPADDFTPEQRFFIGYAQSWCSDDRDEMKRLNAATDPHSPPRYRTNGVVSNMPEFRAAFACRADSPMVREKTCRVW